jgi:hypothetical protein
MERARYAANGYKGEGCKSLSKGKFEYFYQTAYVRARIAVWFFQGRVTVLKKTGSHGGW